MPQDAIIQDRAFNMLQTTNALSTAPQRAALGSVQYDPSSSPGRAVFLLNETGDGSNTVDITIQMSVNISLTSEFTSILRVAMLASFAGGVKGTRGPFPPRNFLLPLSSTELWFLGIKRSVSINCCLHRQGH